MESFKLSESYQSTAWWKSYQSTAWWSLKVHQNDFTCWLDPWKANLVELFVFFFPPRGSHSPIWLFSFLNQAFLRWRCFQAYFLCVPVLPFRLIFITRCHLYLARDVTDFAETRMLEFSKSKILVSKLYNFWKLELSDPVVRQKILDDIDKLDDYQVRKTRVKTLII